MAWLSNPIVCDVCGVVKQPSNNWWYAEIRPVEDEGNPGFLLCPWDYPAEDRSKNYTHLCGQACAIRALSEFMGAPNQPQWAPDGLILRGAEDPEDFSNPKGRK